MAVSDWNRKAAMLREHQDLNNCDWGCSYIVLVCSWAHVSVCLNVCTCECNCVSSLIALTPSSVKWDGLPLSVFKRGAQRAKDELKWWIMQAVCEMSLLAVKKLEKRVIPHWTRKNHTRMHVTLLWTTWDVPLTVNRLHPVYFKIVRPRLQFSHMSQHSFIVFF